MRIINRIIPFFMAVFIFILLVSGFVLLAYLILFSVLLGIIVFVVNSIRARFAPPKPKTEQPTQTQGRIIDSDDWRKL